MAGNRKYGEVQGDKIDLESVLNMMNNKSKNIEMYVRNKILEIAAISNISPLRKSISSLLWVQLERLD